MIAGSTIRNVNTSIVIEVSPATASDLLAAVADPVRWRLLAALTGGTRCVCQLQPIAAVSAPALSHHLKVLRDAGLVSSARRGRWIDYTLAPDAPGRLRAALPTAAMSALDALDCPDAAGGQT
jgi:ArsR family transcriptional regulator